MSHYILVHGAWCGSWAWEHVVPLLENKGHKVTAIDLPGSSTNPASIGEVTMAGYVQILAHLINQQNE